MSRKEFESRKDSDPTDTYLLIGTGEVLNNFVTKNREQKLGWENPSSWPSSVNVTSTAKIKYLNIDNISQFNGESYYESPYPSIMEKLYLVILHEDGHQKFEGHSKNYK